MKKHIIAGAVVAAFAAPAFAQNVQLYGAIDLNVRSLDRGDVRMTSYGNDPLATSRIGLRGSEDLGGGLKANFQMQGSFNPATGGDASGDGVQSFTFNEELWVGLSGNFGELRFGRTDLTGLQALDSTVGQSGNTFNTVSGSGASSLGELGNNMSSVIRYLTPTVNGFQADIAYRFADNAAATAKDSQPSQTAVLLSYKAGPLGLYAGSATQDGEAGDASVAKRAYEAIGATYDAGFAKFGLLSSRADVSSTSNAKDAKQTIVSAVVPFGNGYTVHAGYMTAKGAGTTNTSDGYSVVVAKALSKRTSLYAGYTDVTNDAGANRSWSLAGVASGSEPTAGSDISAFAVGVAHTF